MEGKVFFSLIFGNVMMFVAPDPEEEVWCSDKFNRGRVLPIGLHVHHVSWSFVPPLPLRLAWCWERVHYKLGVQHSNLFASFTLLMFFAIECRHVTADHTQNYAMQLVSPSHETTLPPFKPQPPINRTQIWPQPIGLKILSIAVVSVDTHSFSVKMCSTAAIEAEYSSQDENFFHFASVHLQCICTNHSRRKVNMN